MNDKEKIFGLSQEEVIAVGVTLVFVFAGWIIAQFMLA